DFGLQISASDLPRGNHEVLTSYLGKPNGKWDVIQAYWRLEPRVSVRWTVNSRSSLKAAVARHSQYIHQLSNATSSLPTDAWVLSSNNVKPQQADQYSIGYYYNWTTRPYNFSLETYYKDLFHQMDYRDGADLPADDHIDAELVFGIGRAYGVEALFKKERGAWNGWLAYSWSKSERLFEHLNQGNWFHARQDRTQDSS